MGLYLLRLIVNPDKLVVESDHGNNILTCTIELRDGFRMQPYHCRLSGKHGGLVCTVAHNEGVQASITILTTIHGGDSHATFTGWS